jgi:hypothetical protein
MTYPELEIFLYRRGETEYATVWRLQEPTSADDHRVEAEPIRIDTTVFEDDVLLADPKRYGLTLGRALFDHPAARQVFDQATARALGAGAPLRVRLCTDQRSLKLHRLRWELLRVPDRTDPDNPDRANWLAINNSVLFSRHLFSGDMRPVRLRPQSALTALVAIADPTDVARYSAGNRPLSPIAVQDELATAEQGLQQLQKERLVPEAVPRGKRVTLERLLAALGREPDVLYLVCHGAIVDGEPRLLLENDDGTGHVVSGLDLVRAFAPLQNLPRLVVLISCKSGGDGNATGAPTDRAVLSAIGPRLAEAGVPAVLAMQGDLRMQTARAFLPPFFAALQRTGQIDEAVTHGRAAVQDAPDAWVPVLYTRLVEGRVWFTKGLTSRDEFNAWQQLAIQINKGKCVPILGPGVLEPFVGTTRELANCLAMKNGYPQVLSGREDLPEVAQFLETMRGSNSPQVQIPVVTEMAEGLRRRYPALHLEPVSRIDPGNDLRESLTAAWRVYQEGRPYEPHRYLAGMRKIRTIISTNPDYLLEEALTAAGRPPRVHMCRWDERGDEVPGGELARDLADDRPDVFHLMGQLSDLDTLVVTEDDYFRFLTANTRKQAQTKNPDRPDDLADDLLRGALASSALVFLGFRVADWDFRTLCRLLLDQKGGNNRRNRTHIAVQIDPEDGTHRDAVRARDFIERLFRGLLGLPAEGQVAVFWGSPEDFIEELDRQWKTLQPNPPKPALAGTTKA